MDYQSYCRFNYILYLVLHNARHIYKLTYAIGDIHGCLEELIELIQKLNLEKKDKLVFIGDYIDRGPDPKGVIDVLLSLRVHYNCIFIRGNHEQMLLDYIDNDYKGSDWLLNGYEATVESYGGSVENIPENHIDFFRDTVFYYQEKEFVFVHAGVRPNIPLKEQKVEDLLWIRSSFLNVDNPLFEKRVVFGHTPFLNPMIKEYKIGIDTGCVFKGKLTAFRTDDYEVFQT